MSNTEYLYEIYIVTKLADLTEYKNRDAIKMKSEKYHLPFFIVLHIYFIVVTHISKSRLNSKGRLKVPPQEVHPKQENYCRACEERTRYSLTVLYTCSYTTICYVVLMLL